MRPSSTSAVAPSLKEANDFYRVDEAYMKIKKQCMTFIELDSAGHTLDFLSSATRAAMAAERFFRKALRTRHSVTRRVITVDKNAAYPPAFEVLQQTGALPDSCTRRQCKSTVRQKAKNPQSTYVRVRRVREDVFSLLLSLGKQHERRGMRAQKVILRGPFARPPTPFAHSSAAPSRCSCGSHRSARPLLGSENTPKIFWCSFTMRMSRSAWLLSNLLVASFP